MMFCTVIYPIEYSRPSEKKSQTFSILYPMEPNIHALGTFWLDLFVDHYLRHGIVRFLSVFGPICGPYPK